jgi:hypothetical protein
LLASILRGNMMDQPTEEKLLVENPKWPLEDDLPLFYANQFAIYETDQEVVLIFGSFIPTGFAFRSKEEIKDYLKTAEVKPLTKVVMSRSGWNALYGLIKKRMELKGETPHD